MGHRAKHKEELLYTSLDKMDTNFYTDPLDDLSFREYRDISLYEVWEYALCSLAFVILGAMFYEARRLRGLRRTRNR
jgi:hypothetical protein